MAAGTAQRLASNFAKAPLQLAAVERWVFAHTSSDQNKFVAEGWRNRTAREGATKTTNVVSHSAIHIAVPESMAPLDELFTVL